MNLKYNLSETECEIMEVLWERKEFIKTRELLDLFNEKRKKLEKADTKHLFDQTGGNESGGQRSVCCKSMRYQSRL